MLRSPVKLRGFFLCCRVLRNQRSLCFRVLCGCQIAKRYDVLVQRVVHALRKIVLIAAAIQLFQPREQQRVAQQKAYEEAQRQKAQAEYQRQLAEYERQKAQYEQDMARYRQEKAAYDAEMARRAAQSDEAAQADAQTAPRRRRAPQQKPRTYSDYVSGETVERLPDPPQWPQVQQAAEAAKKPKKGLVSRVAKMMEEDDGNEIAGINALPPRVSKDEAYHPAKTPQKNGKRKR